MSRLERLEFERDDDESEFFILAVGFEDVATDVEVERDVEGVGFGEEAGGEKKM